MSRIAAQGALSLPHCIKNREWRCRQSSKKDVLVCVLVVILNQTGAVLGVSKGAGRVEIIVVAGNESEGN